MPRDFVSESLSHDPVHGYIPFISGDNLPKGEVAEQEIIDHPDFINGKYDIAWVEKYLKEKEL